MTSPQPQPGTNDNPDEGQRAKAAATAATDSPAGLPTADSLTETERAADAMLERETYGQTLDPERDGQRQADQQDDSMRSEMQAPPGSAPDSDLNLPDQLVRPNDYNYTLPEEH